MSNRVATIVIDTDISRAVGESVKDDPRAGLCREFLETMRGAGHSFVDSPSSFEERQRHASKFFRHWVKSMLGRKQFVLIDPPRDKGLEVKLEQTVQSENDREAMRKDHFLIRIVLAADRRIASMDENTARRLFKTAAKSVPQIRGICWVNPEHASERPIEWLISGAPLDPERLLGF